MLAANFCRDIPSNNLLTFLFEDIVSRNGDEIMFGQLKIVDFDKYCGTCKHREEDPDIEESPCDVCLSIPAREDSRRPEKYEEDKALKKESTTAEKILDIAKQYKAKLLRKLEDREEEDEHA